MQQLHIEAGQPSTSLGCLCLWGRTRCLGADAHAFAYRNDESMPGLAKLQPIPFHELFVRLCYKFDDTMRNPELDKGVQDEREAFDDSLIDTLALYLHFADVIYEAGTEGRLLDIIAEQGGSHICMTYAVRIPALKGKQHVSHASDFMWYMQLLELLPVCCQSNHKDHGHLGCCRPRL